MTRLSTTSKPVVLIRLKATSKPVVELPGRFRLCGRCGRTVEVNLGGKRSWCGYCRDCIPHAVEAGWIENPLGRRRAAA